MTTETVEETEIISTEQVDMTPMQITRDSLTDRAKSLIVATPEDVQEADQILLVLASSITMATEKFRPIRDSTTKAWRDGIELEKSIIGPLEDAKKALSQKRGAAVRAIADAAAEKARLERERLRREEEERRLTVAAEEERLAAEALTKAATQRGEAAQLSAEGRDAEADMKLEDSQENARVAEVAQAKSEIILETPIPVVAVSAKAFEAPKTVGVSTRETWSAECFDLAALVKAVSENPDQYLGYLQVNEKALNGVARALKAQMRIPGCKANVDYGTATRSK